MNNPISVFWNDLKVIDGTRTRCRSVAAAVSQLGRVKLTEIIRAKKDLRFVYSNIDTNGLKAICEKHSGDKSYETKWISTRLYLQKNLRRIYQLQLMEGKQLDILDLGAGAGYFCFLCGLFGHNVTALDLDDQPLFNDLIEFFGVQRVSHRIVPFEPLPQFGKRFDLVTGFLTVFNQPHRHNPPWGAPQWDYFLDDLAKNVLKDDGRALFVLNRPFDHCHYTKTDVDLFVKKGGRVIGRNLYFENVSQQSIAV